MFIVCSGVHMIWIIKKSQQLKMVYNWEFTRLERNSEICDLSVHEYIIKCKIKMLWNFGVAKLRSIFQVLRKQN